MEEKILKYTFNSDQTPVIDGYVIIDKIPQQDLVNVIYEHVGRIIPVDVEGRVIKGVEPHYYLNDQNDPYRVSFNQRVPIVKGYCPRRPFITPADATVDTIVIYDANSWIEFPQSDHRFHYSENFGADSHNVAGWDGNLGPHGEHVERHGLIVNAYQQVIGYVDQTGKAYYIFSPVINNNKKEIVTQSMWSLGLIGLSGLKLRRRYRHYY